LKNDFLKSSKLPEFLLSGNRLSFGSNQLLVTRMVFKLVSMLCNVP